MEDSLRDIIFNSVICDYYTPNVKVEPIIDCMLTHGLATIINRLCGLKTSYITKEMSIPDLQPGSTNMDSKIDYVLADDTTVYLTELKTTPSSGSDKQIEHYLGLCENFKFGNSLGKRLLDILCKYFKKKMPDSLYNDEGFAWLFREIVRKTVPNGMSYGRIAQDFVRENGYAWKSWERSKKYALTLGEILDYLDDGKNSLWGKKMQVICLMPKRLIISQSSPLIVKCQNGRCPTLEDAARVFELEKDEYSQFLSKVLKYISPDY